MRIKLYKRAPILVLSVAIMLTGLYFVRNREVIELTEEIRNQAAGKFVTIDNGQVHYKLEGDAAAPLVVLVHGFSIPNYIWDNTAKSLVQNGYQVLRYDLYGRGFSDRPDATYNRELFVTQLSQVVNKIAPDTKFDLIGISMGGPIVADYAKSNPTRVKHLVLMAPLGLGVDIHIMGVPVIGEYIAAIGMVDSIEKKLKNNFYNPDKNFPDWSEKYSYQTKIIGFRRALLSSMREFAQHDQWQVYSELGQTELPVLLVWGKEDTIVPFSQYELIKQHIPNAKLVAIEDAGHVVNIEGADVVDPALVEFFGGE